MTKEEVPQDNSSLGNITREVCYATDKEGKYTTALSKGWDVKSSALDTVWKETKEKAEECRQKVLNNQASPLLFFMELKMMDISLLASYTGFWKWRIKRHLIPSVFNKLSQKKLQRYADAFSVTIEDLKSMNVHED